MGGGGVPGGRTGKKVSQGGRSWNVAGGAGRDHSVLMEVEVDKVHVHYNVCAHTHVHVCAAYRAHGINVQKVILNWSMYSMCIAH